MFTLLCRLLSWHGDQKMRNTNGFVFSLVLIAASGLMCSRRRDGQEILATETLHEKDNDDNRTPQETSHPLPTDPGVPGSLSDGDPQMLQINLTGSLQNPAWSPDGSQLLITRWRSGYNVGPADLVIVDVATGGTRTLISDNNDNVNLPGSAWNGTTGKIIFSSAREPHDEIFIIDAAQSTGAEIRVTNRTGFVAFEPSFSQDGQSFVFESHTEEQDTNGVITKFRIDGAGTYQALTAATDDCREPNWSPTDSLIVYQKLNNNQWDLWVMKPDGSGQRQVTTGVGNKTDASFSADGQYIVYSSDAFGLDFGNLFAVSITGGEPTRITTHVNGYDGAPSWSPAASLIAFESTDGDPDDSAGTTIWLVEYMPMITHVPYDD